MKFRDLNKYFAGILILGLTACASGTKRGSIVMKLDDREAHVSMGEGEVFVGDHLALYRNTCNGTNSRISGAERSCKKEEIGHGEVVKVLNSHYSCVRFPANTTFSEGDTLEKNPH